MKTLRWFRKFIIHRERQRRNTVLSRIRGQFLFFGHDCSDMTDRELTRGIVNIQQKIQSFRMTSKEVLDFSLQIHSLAKIKNKTSEIIR